MDKQARRQIDRLMFQTLQDREELLAALDVNCGIEGPKREILQRGLACVAEVMSGLQRLRQALDGNTGTNHGQ